MSAQRRNHRIEENPGGEGASGRVESKRLTQNSRQVVDGAPVGDGENSEGEREKYKRRATVSEQSDEGEWAGDTNGERSRSRQ